MTLGRQTRGADVTVTAGAESDGPPPAPGGRGGPGRRLPALSSTAWPPSSAWPATSATTPQGSSSRWRARPRPSQRFEAPAGRRGAAAGRASTASSVHSLDVRADARLPHRRQPTGPGQAGPSSRPTWPCATTAWPSCSIPADRRYRYPFINCTNCGPRFTITRPPALRPTQHDHGADSPCARPAPAEYHDPADRRFHAQPIACAGVRSPAVVRRIRRDHRGGHRRRAGRGPGGPGRRARSWPSRGSAATTWPVTPPIRRRWRRCAERKHRPDKPFAVMVPGPGGGAGAGRSGRAEAALLLGSPERPIVLVRRRRPGALGPVGGPGKPAARRCSSRTRPCTTCCSRRSRATAAPVPDGLVMTSGNLTDEPICFDDADARAPAGRHRRRPGWSTTAPSTCRATTRWSGSRAAVELPIRRSRGYAPLPVRLPFAVAAAAGHGRRAEEHVLPGLGPRRLGEPAHRRHGQPRDPGRLRTVGPAVRRDVRRPADQVAADTHPGTRPDAGPRTTPPARWSSVQHHHAHIASVMAEHGVPQRPGGHRVRLRRHRVRTGRGHLGRRGPGGLLRGVRPGRPPALTCPCPAGTPPCATRPAWRWPTCGRPASPGTRDLPPVQALSRRGAPGAGRPAGADRSVRADVEHGPAVRRGQLARRTAPYRLLRGPGGHGARSGGRPSHCGPCPAYRLRHGTTGPSIPPR